MWLAEGAFGDQRIARHDLRRFARKAAAQFEVAGVDHALAFVFDERLRRTENMARRIKGQLEVAEIFGLVKVEQQRVCALDAVLEDARRRRRRDDALMMLNVIGVRVRDDRQRAAPPRVQPQINFRQINSLIVYDSQNTTPSCLK